MGWIVENLRASLFTEAIPYSWDLINHLRQVLPGEWLPSSKNVLQPADPSMLAPEWSFLSPDGKTILVSWKNKIDLISAIKETPADILPSFCKTAKDVFVALLKFSSGHAYRFAIAPKYECADTPDDQNKWIKGIFNKNSFEGATVDECSFTQTYRVEKGLDGVRVHINFLARLQQEQREEKRDGRSAVIIRYYCDFDINSVPAANIPYPVETMSAFFDSAPKLCSQFEEYYFG